jgi:hypothetical protein
MKWGLICIFLLSVHIGRAQGVHSILDKSTNPGEVLMEFDHRSPSVKGDYYILEQWENGDIVLSSGVIITDQLMNYDLEFDLLEVRLKDQIKVVPLNKIDYFTFNLPTDQKRLFKPCQVYFYQDNVPLAGACEVIDSSYYGLIIKYISDVKEATYVPALDMGEKDHEIIIRKKYYLTIGDLAVEIPKKRREFLDIFRPHSSLLESYMKENKLKYKKENDLQRILSYFNTLISP